MDEMDLEEEHGDLQTAFARWRGRTLIVSFDTDWLFPPAESVRVAAAMQSLETPVMHHEIASANGHDTFLIDFPLIDGLVREFLCASF
jgi:homoserine O-acetyltransferase